MHNKCKVPYCRRNYDKGLRINSGFPKNKNLYIVGEEDYSHSLGPCDGQGWRVCCYKTFQGKWYYHKLEPYLPALHMS